MGHSVLQCTAKLLSTLYICHVLCSGVCLGLQCAVIEFARDILGWTDAHSTEADTTTTHPVVCFGHLCTNVVYSKASLVPFPC